MKTKNLFFMTLIALFGVVYESSGQAPTTWNTVGNSVTYPQEFIGTTNYSPLIFKVNNTFSGNIQVGNIPAGNISNINNGETSFGYKSLQSLNNYGSSAFGAYSLSDNTTGIFNSAFGSGALHKNTTGNYNTAVGNWALKNNFNGQFNTAIGNYSMLSNIDGIWNVAVGMSSLQANTSGHNNVAVGSRALLANLTGSYNVAVGNDVLGNANFNGEGNTAINGGGNLTTGNYNSIFGYGAGSTTGVDGLSTGSYNSLFGLYAGNAMTTGSNNVMIGNNCGVGLKTGSYNTFLGSVGIANPSIDNTIILADGITNQRLYIHGNGYTGIGLGNNVIPQNKLEINTAGTNSVLGYSSAAVAGTSGLRFRGYTSAIVPTVSASKFLTVNGTGDVVLQNLPADTSWKYGGNAVPALQTLGTTSAFDLPFVTGNATGSSEKMRLTKTTGYLGIGTAAPSTRLQITSDLPNDSGLRLTNLTSAIVPTTTALKFLTVDTTGKVILQNLPAGNVAPVISLSSSVNTMSSAINGGTAVTAPIVNSVSNQINSSGQLVTYVNGVPSNNLQLPSTTTVSAGNTSVTVTPSGNNYSIVANFPLDNDNNPTNELSNLAIQTQSPLNVRLTNPATTGNSITLPSYKAGNNISITPDTSVANGFFINNSLQPYTAGTNVTINNNQISSNDTSIYANNGTINAATTIGINREVNMNDRNIWFKTDTSANNGRVYIGNAAIYPTTAGNYRLYVEGGILSERMRVALKGTAFWADSVFANDYKLMPLNEVETFIKENKHLPGIESADELVKKGLDLGDMQAKQMGKIEELTLHAIEQNKTLEKQSQEIEELKAQVKLLLEKK
jgi:trimeric autotransporter adhesin